MLNTRIKKLLATIFLVLTSLVGVGVPQIQRLFISETDLTLGPNGKAKIKTYCSDFGVPGPKQTQQYSQLLSDEASIQLLIGGKPMSLQDAIQKNKIELRTPAPTIGDLRELERIFHTVDPAAHLTWSQTAASLGPAERLEFLAKQQNPLALELVNKSGETIEFHAKRALLGTEPTSGLPIPSVVRSQEHLWISQIQEGLVANGYSIAVDGTVGSGTRSALEDFQSRLGLDVTKRPDTATADVLRQLAALDDNWLHSEESSKFIRLRIENRPNESSRLKVIDSSGKVVYSGNREHELIDAVIALPADPGVTKYGELVGFPSVRADNLITSFQTYPKVPPDSPIRLISRVGISRFGRDVISAKGIRMELDAEPEAVSSGPRTGWFRAVLRFFVKLGSRTREVTVEVLARTQEHLREFLGRADVSAASAIDMDQSIAEFVSDGRKRLIKRFGNSNDVDTWLLQQSRKLLVKVIREDSASA